MERLKVALAERYAIEREIGSGGMATVYLAEDLKHRRNVALKVLRPELAATMGPQRFLHEIEIAAQLQHPHILPLHDSGEAAGFLYYVMPYVEGQTLRDRLLREGALPIDSAVRILIEVTDALVEAHRRGLVHRDIKPENVLFTGRHAVVTDFGVAKAVNEAASRYKVTTAGVALGTPDYMAPEQATAEPNLDHRVDIYAVGAMAYEMLTGRPPFSGNSAAAVLVAHLTQTPKPIAEQRPSVAPALEAIVMCCLAKQPDERFQSAVELLAALEPLAAGASGGVTPTGTRPIAGITASGSRRPLILGGIAGVVMVAIAAALWLPGEPSALELGPIRPVTTDPGLELQPSLSPDGALVAYVAGPVHRLRLYVRSVAGGAPIAVARDLPGLQQSPAFSPDGSRILFDSDRVIYVVPHLGGVPALVVEGSPGERFIQPIWSPSGTEIAYIKDFRELRVRAFSGGVQRVVARGLGIHSPAWSPDGRLIAYVADNPQFARGGGSLGNLATSSVMIVPAAGGDPVRLSNSDFLRGSPVWLPDSRHLLFMSTEDGSRDVYLVAIDGSGSPVGPVKRLTTGLDAASLSLSADGGTLAYSAFQNTSNIWSIQIPSTGTATGAAARPVTRGTQHIESMDVSRDGKWLAYDSDRNGNPHIYKMPLAGGEPQQLTLDTAYNFVPRWSPDGREIAFQTPRAGRGGWRSIYIVPASGGPSTYVGRGAGASWSPDGDSLAIGSGDVTGGIRGVFLVTRGTDGQWGAPRRLSDSGSGPAWSPLGGEIAVGLPGRLTLVSTDGSVLREVLHPGNWRLTGICCHTFSPDGKTIYFEVQPSLFQAPDEHVAPFDVWAIPERGGMPRRVVHFDSVDIRPARQGIATDGERIYFIVAEHQSDIKVMEVRFTR